MVTWPSRGMDAVQPIASVCVEDAQTIGDVRRRAFFGTTSVWVVFILLQSAFFGTTFPVWVVFILLQSLPWSIRTSSLIFFRFHSQTLVRTKATGVLTCATGSPMDPLYAAHFAHTTGNHQDAIRKCTELLRTNPYDQAVWYLKARAIAASA